MSNAAAVDIGTNTVRLLITTDIGKTLVREAQVTRLGAGVDEHRALADEAMSRTLAVLSGYGALLKTHAVGRARVVATSAARDASNRDLFFDAVAQALGYRPELVSGEVEAELCFAGATGGRPASEAPFAVLDIGGGSTEFALGKSFAEHRVSLELGSLRISERFYDEDPPSRIELDEALEAIEEELAEIGFLRSIASTLTWIGVAGTVTSVAALSLGLRTYDAEATHNMHLSAAQVEQAFERLSHAPLAERRKLLLEPKRADTIIGGVSILHAVLRHFKLNYITVSERDILDGIAASLLIPAA